MAWVYKASSIDSYARRMGPSSDHLDRMFVVMEMLAMQLEVQFAFERYRFFIHENIQLIF